MPGPEPARASSVSAAKPNSKTVGAKPKNVRLLLHVDALHLSARNTFEAAAKTVGGDYRKHYPGDSIIIKFVKSGEEIAKVINDNADGSIVSLDIFSHGNQGGIHIARKLAKPVPAPMMQQQLHVMVRSSGPNRQTEADAQEMEESLHGLYTDARAIDGAAIYYNQDKTATDKATLDKIQFAKFAKDAFVEFHGCRIAEMHPVASLYLGGTNFAKAFSEKMPPGGTVVGHITNSAPNNHPTNKGKHSDYRYGKVQAFQGGKKMGSVGSRWGMKFKNSSTP